MDERFRPASRAPGGGCGPSQPGYSQTAAKNIETGNQRYIIGNCESESVGAPMLLATGDPSSHLTIAAGDSALRIGFAGSVR